MSDERINVYPLGFGMNKKELIIKEISNLSEARLAGVLEFVYLIKSRQDFDDDETLEMSRNLLAKDWLDPVEDEVWGNL